MTSSRRRASSQNVYDKHIDGIYGASFTNESHKIEYLLSTLTVEDAVNDLSTALDVLAYEKLDFSQIIQRDIDVVRVDEKIINGYLKQGLNRVVFFPPLIVALIHVDDGIPAEMYPSASTLHGENYRNWGDVIFKRWDDLFQLAFIPETESTNWSISVNGQPVHFENFNVGLDYKSRNIKLIVVDGQHRLMALKRCHSATPEIVRNMSIPVCVFMPSESPGGDVDENVIKDMRELFVTINTEAQKVSGHFRDLLNDKKISCECVRSLANTWKGETDSSNGTKSRLHLLEWNQRSDNKKAQRTVPYSITTVSIITDVLDDILNDSFHKILLLSERQAEIESLEAVGEPCYDEMGNEEFGPGGFKILKDQVAKYVTPALDILLRSPIPYCKLENQLNAELNKLNECGHAHGVNAFKKRLFEFRMGIHGYDDPESLAVENSFKSAFDGTLSEDECYYLTNVFQNGLLLAWGDLSCLLFSYEIDPVKAAALLVKSMNSFAFTTNIWSPSRQFTRGLLFDGHKIKFTDYSKKACKSLILSTLLSKKSWGCLLKLMDEFGMDEGPKLECVEKIKQLCLAEFLSYRNELAKQRLNSLSRSWKYNDSIPAGIKTRLESSPTDRERKIILSDSVVELEVTRDISVLENLLDVSLAKG